MWSLRRRDFNIPLSTTHCCSNVSMERIESMNLVVITDSIHLADWEYLPFIWKQKYHFPEGCVCLCVCVWVGECAIYVYLALNIFHTIPVVDYLCLPVIFTIPAIRQLQCLPCYTPIIFPHSVWILDIISPCRTLVCPWFDPAKVQSVPSPPRLSAQVAARWATLCPEVRGVAGC